MQRVRRLYFFICPTICSGDHFFLRNVRTNVKSESEKWELRREWLRRVLVRLSALLGRYAPSMWWQLFRDSSLYIVLLWRPMWIAICCTVRPCLLRAANIYLSFEVSCWYVIRWIHFLAGEKTLYYHSSPHLLNRMSHLVYEFGTPNKPLKPTRFRGTCFVQDRTKQAPLQWLD